jgi:hypothetical protein
MADDEYDPDALDAKEEDDDESVSQQDKGAAACVLCLLHCCRCTLTCRYQYASEQGSILLLVSLL